MDLFSKSNLPPYPIEVQHPNIARFKNANSGIDYVHILEASKPGPTVMLNSLMHGNEYSGAVVLSELLDSGIQPRCGKWIISFSNVNSFLTFNTSNPDRSRFLDIDMNRVWSLEKLESHATVREVQRAREIQPLIKDVDYLLDLHSMHEECEPLMVSAMTDKAFQFAKHMGFPRVIMRDEGHADGKRLIDYEFFANESLGPVALLIEAGQHWSHLAIENSKHTLYRFLMGTGTISQELIDQRYQEEVSQVEVKVTHRCVASSLEVQFVQNWLGMEVIEKAGTVIAYDSGKPIVTPYDDCVLIMPSLRQVLPGVTYVRLGQQFQIS